MRALNWSKQVHYNSVEETAYVRSVLLWESEETFRAAPTQLFYGVVLTFTCISTWIFLATLSSLFSEKYSTISLSFRFFFGFVFGELPLNIENAENVQTFCRRARHSFQS